MHEFGEQNPPIEVAKVSEILRPSDKLAWVVGFLCGGSKVNGGVILITDSSREVAEQFLAVSSELFQASPRFREVRLGPDRHPTFQVQYSSTTGFTQALGDFRKSFWADTLERKYKWIFSHEFVPHFLSGYFDKLGGVNGKQDNELYEIRLRASSESAVRVLTNLLQIIGITSLSKMKDAKRGGAMAGISIQQFDSVCELSMKLYSCVHKREEILKKIRRGGVTKIDIDPNRIEAHHRVLDLHKTRPELSNVELAKDPSLAQFGITRHDVYNWVERREDPNRSSAKRKRRFVSEPYAVITQSLEEKVRRGGSEAGDIPMLIKRLAINLAKGGNFADTEELVEVVYRAYLLFERAKSRQNKELLVTQMCFSKNYGELMKNCAKLEKLMNFRAWTDG